jgi:putative cardiolipin synthase
MRKLPSVVVAIVAMAAQGCALKPATQYPREASYAMADQLDTPLGRMVGPEIAAHHGESGFDLLTTGMESFGMRMALVKAAARTIDLQYYLFRADDTGKLLMDALMNAARRGVRVRIMIDDYATAGEDDYLVMLDASPNVHVRVFNAFGQRGPKSRLPEYIMGIGRSNHRMHNKSFIVDNEVALVGGRNIGDEYFAAKADYVMRDIDALAVGPVAQEVSRKFDDYWNSASAYPIGDLDTGPHDAGQLAGMRQEIAQHAQRMRNSDYCKGVSQTDLAREIGQGTVPLTWAPAEVISDSPLKAISHRLNDAQSPAWIVKDLARQARQEMIIVSPYFVPSEDGIGILKALHQRGARVRVLTNSLASTDTPAVHTAYRRYRQAIMEAGVELYEYKPVSDLPIRRSWMGSARFGLHAKTYVFDRRDLVIGSFNMDPRSTNLDTETALVIHSPELARQVVGYFDQSIDPQHSYTLRLMPRPGLWPELIWVTRENGKQVVFDDEPHASLALRLRVELLSLLPIEWML